MEQGRIVTNEAGDKAWWNGKDLTPVRIEPGTTGVEPGTNMTITDQPPPRGRVVTNAQGHKAWWDGQNLMPVAQGQASQMQADVAHSEATGASLKGTPGPAKLEPARPRVLPIPRPPGVELQERMGWPIANFAAGMTPVGRAGKAAIGAGMSAAEDISHGKMPSPVGMGIGAVSGLIPEGLVQGGKFLARQGAKMLGKGPMVKGAEAAATEITKAPTVKAASEAFEQTKNIATPMAGASDEFATLSRELMKKSGRGGLAKEVEDTIGEELATITNARLAGKALNYGEVFQRARGLSDKAMNATGNERAQLFKLHDAYVKDLSSIGPEAQQAVAGYKLAKSSERIVNAVKAGNPDSVAKALEKAGEQFTPQQAKDLTTIASHLGKVSNEGWKQIAGHLGISATTGIFTHMPGVSVATLAPGLIMSSLVRLPGGAGVSIAKSLVSPEGEISKLVLPALGQSMRSMIHEKGLHGND